MNGLVHIYTGNGKGKTTAAIGLGIRAYGRGLKVFMAQFLKGMETGEINTIKKLEPGFTLYRGTSINKFTWEMNADEFEKAKKAQQDIFSHVLEAAQSGRWNLIIMDEIMAAISAGFINLEDVKNFIKNKPGMLEVVMTGRNAPQDLIELADYVSEIKEVKHPIKRGIPARKGIEI
ncbi:MAG TPA: cob(I)yrinic acid a,c-diamide adenosyltransferase [Clostridiaceae bacterium]|nr:cob(I)yrinic acid a,c-diamide adenosyltransferase [Clostridiaceae bacterium]